MDARFLPNDKNGGQLKMEFKPTENQSISSEIRDKLKTYVDINDENYIIIDFDDFNVAAIKDEIEKSVLPKVDQALESLSNSELIQETQS